MERTFSADEHDIDLVRDIDVEPFTSFSKLVLPIHYVYSFILIFTSFTFLQSYQFYFFCILGHKIIPLHN